MPQNAAQLKSQMHATIALAAWFTMLLGAVIMAGWHIHSLWLAEQAPWLLFTRYNTALMMLISGAGLLAALKEKKTGACMSALCVLAFSVLSLAQYVFDVDLGMDQFFVTDYLHEKASPGRMAPNTAVAFICVGFALLLAGAARNGRWRIIALEMLSFTIFAIGLTALTGYLVANELAYSWGGKVRMGIPTAASAMVLGIGFMAFSWKGQSLRALRVPLWLPALLCFFVLLLDIVTPFEMAMGVVYVPIIFCSLWFTRPSTAFVFAGTATVLAILGYFSSDSDLWFTTYGLINRFTNIVILWFVAVLVYMGRQTEGKLQQSENRLRAVVDHALDGLISINKKGQIEHFNPACERIFGYRADEVVGQNIKVLMPEPYHSEHDGYLRNYLTTGQAKIIGTAGREVKAKRKDGSVFPMDLSVSAFYLDGDTHFSGIIRDITERKEAEKKLMVYMRDLERSNQELDDFAYIASHDLKEPLRGLYNHASFLREDYQDRLDEDGVRRLNRLAQLCQRMERLVNDLLYFSRLGRVDLAVQETDPNQIVDEVANLSEAFLKDRCARITVPKPMPVIVCDRPRITEVFRNLIMNAVKYNDKPEPHVEIGFLPRLQMADGAEEKVFYVRDNGIGIAPEFYEEIFRIFKRLQPASGAAEDGTGSGLTFVKKIIERHKGRVWLDSTPGVGTVFYFTINRMEERHERSAA